MARQIVTVGSTCFTTVATTTSRPSPTTKSATFVTTPTPPAAGAWGGSAVRHTGLGTTEFAEEGAVEAAGGWHCSQWKGNGVEGAGLGAKKCMPKPAATFQIPPRAQGAPGRRAPLLRLARQLDLPRLCHAALLRLRRRGHACDSPMSRNTKHRRTSLPMLLSTTLHFLKRGGLRYGGHRRR